MFGSVSTYLYITLLPFYKPSMNIANIIHSMVFVFSTLLVTCAWLRGVPEVRRVLSVVLTLWFFFSGLAVMWASSRSDRGGARAEV